MKSIVIYYSYGGNTRHVAEKVAAAIVRILLKLRLSNHIQEVMTMW